MDFGAKLISGGLEIYRNAEGASEEHLHLDLLASDLISLSSSLTPDFASTRAISRDEQKPLKLASSCKDLADEFLVTLERLKVQGHHRKWKSFVQALKSVGKEKAIQDYRKRLDEFRSQLTVRLVAILTWVNLLVGI